MAEVAIPITGDEAADRFLTDEPLALLIGMLLDQQVPMEWAFRGPATLSQRLGGLDASAIAAMDREDFVAVCAAKPAIHRFPASMGRRIHQLCVVLESDYGGDAAAPVERGRRCRGAPSPPARPAGLRRREDEDLHCHPRQALRGHPHWLGGRWRHRSPTTSPGPSPMSTPAESLARVRDWKKMMKAAKRDKHEDPVSK